MESILSRTQMHACARLVQVYSLSVESWQWKEHTAVVEGEAPTPRSGHSAVALPGERYDHSALCTAL